jgi:Tol biopolymer transport system component
MTTRGLRSATFISLLVASSSVGIASAPARSGAVIAVAFSPDGKLLVSAGIHSPLRVWDPTTGKEVRKLGPESAWFGAAVFSPDGKHVATTEKDGTIKLFDIGGEKAARTIGRHPGADPLSYHPLSFAPDGKTLAAGGPKAVIFWDVENAKETLKIEVPGRSTGSIVFSPDGKRLVSAGEDGLARLWDVGTATEIRSVKHPAPCTASGFSPDGKLVATCSSEGTLKLWESETGKITRTVNVAHTWLPTMSVSFTPDGKLIATGGNEGQLKIWDVQTGKLIRSMAGHRDASFVAFSPDGSKLASGGFHGQDETVRIWDPKNGQELHRLQVR